MATWRNLAILIGAFGAVSSAGAQSQLITEATTRGDCFRYELHMTVTGELRVNRDGKQTPIPLAAQARHHFSERILEHKPKGLPEKVARHYDVAQSALNVNNATTNRELRPDRRLVVAQRGPDRFLCYSPSGPLSRDEKELVSEHFDTLAITGLLPEKEVAVGETWKPANGTVQSLCLFEALISHELSAKLESIVDGSAVIRISGNATGIDLGALVKQKVAATVRYDLLAKRIVMVEWTQNDERDQGPASPASAIEMKVTLKRSLIEQPKELNSVAIESVPQGFDPPAALTQVIYRDTKDRYEVGAHRDWYLVGQTESHVVLRLIERGDLVAQVSLTPGPNAGAGKHISADEFKRIASESPGWQYEELVDEGELTADGGRWIYRVVARGEMDGVKIVQAFYLIAGPKGDQVIATFTMKPPQVAKLGSRDVTLISSIQFPAK